MPKVKKLYICCTDERCRAYQQTVSFLQVWGLCTDQGSDDSGAYFDVSPPAHWLENRRKRFAEALKQQPKLAHGRKK